MKTLIEPEDVERFIRKAKMPGVPPETVAVPGKGFCSWRMVGDIFWVDVVYGDGKWWVEQWRRVAKDAGARVIQLATYRNPKAWMRRYQMRVVGHIMEVEL